MRTTPCRQDVSVGAIPTFVDGGTLRIDHLSRPAEAANSGYNSGQGGHHGAVASMPCHPNLRGEHHEV